MQHLEGSGMPVLYIYRMHGDMNVKLCLYLTVYFTDKLDMLRTIATLLHCMQFVVVTSICFGGRSRREKCGMKSKNVKKRLLCAPKDDVLLPSKMRTGTDSYCMSEYKN
jgi:hypothetical protein